MDGAGDAAFDVLELSTPLTTIILADTPRTSGCNPLCNEFPPSCAVFLLEARFRVPPSDNAFTASPEIITDLTSSPGILLLLS